MGETEETAAAQETLDVLFYEGGIEPLGFARLVEAVEGPNRDEVKSDHVVLILMTYGGSADDAYRIARYLQRTYKTFSLLAPLYCYSAGTLLAMGANRLYVTQHTEFGPLDVQLLKQNEIAPVRRSGLLNQTAFRALADVTFEHFERFMLNIITKSQGIVTFRVASELSASMTAQVMSGVYQRLDPESLASDRRDVEIALAYALRLAEQSQNIDPGSIYRLIHHYPSHSFVIDFIEAADIFKNVDEAPVSFMQLFEQVLAELDLDTEGPTVVKVYSGAGEAGAAEGGADEEPRAGDADPNRESSGEEDSQPSAREDDQPQRDTGAKGGARRSAPAQVGPQDS